MNLDELFAFTDFARWTPIIVTAPFVIIAFVFLFLGLRVNRRAAASRHWRSTNGVILASYVDRRSSLSSGGGRNTAFYPVVLYQYTVDGQSFRGSQRAFGSEIGYGWTRPAQNAVDRYPVGATVDVFYNPVNPSDAVLERRSGGSRTIFILIAVLIFVILACTLAMTFGSFGFAQQIIDSVLTTAVPQ